MAPVTWGNDNYGGNSSNVASQLQDDVTGFHLCTFAAVKELLLRCYLDDYGIHSMSVGSWLQSGCFLHFWCFRGTER